MAAKSSKRKAEESDVKSGFADRFEKLSTQIFPDLPRRFQAFAELIQKFDAREPATFKAHVEREFGKLAPSVGDESGSIWKDLLDMIADPSFAEALLESGQLGAKLAKDEAKADGRYSLLMRLIAEAHTKVPYLPLVLLQNQADPAGMLEQQCAPLDMLAEAERLNGEARSTAVLRAMGEVAEPLYKRYATAIRLLSYVKEDAWPKVVNPDSFGNLVEEAANRLVNYPNLIDGDAAWIRNAVCHKHAEYIVSEDAVDLWDSKRPRIRIPVDLLLEKVKRMYQVSAVTLPRVAQVYLIRNTFLDPTIAGLMFEAFNFALNHDEMTAKRAEWEFQSKIKSLFAPAEAFAKKHFPQTTP
jgi:hypothetical protein